MGSVGSYGTRTCPRCGEVLFEDMEVCYGCLYDFGKEEGAEARAVLLPDPDQEASWDVGMPSGEWELAQADLPHQVPDVREEEPPARGRGVWVRSDRLDAWVAVPDGGLVIGRDAMCDVVLHSHAVSGRHLALRPAGDGIELHDLGSTNPALFQGREVRQTLALHAGDVVDVCGYALVVTGP